VFELLRRYRICHCIPVGGRVQVTEGLITGPAIYLRMHRGKGKDADFTPAELARWAGWISANRGNRTVYVYFNNDWQGFAPRNAVALRRLLQDD
jgi:uncharacterized protein YecE (DUF72 family)